MIWIDSAAGRFGALAWGDPGAPLALVLHGFPDHPPSFAGIGERLAAAGYRAVAPYLRGYAPSPSVGPYHVGQLARDVVDIAAVLSPREPVRVVGHDWGALATYRALALAPDRFAAAAALSVPHPVAFARNLLRQPRQLARSWYIGALQLPGIGDWAVRRNDMSLIRRLWRDWSPSYALGDAAWCALRDCIAASLPAPIRYYRHAVSPGLFPGRIETPVLYLHGEDDGCIGFEIAAGQDALFPCGYRAEILPGVGHFLALEDPERVSGLIADWLTRQ